MSNENRFPVNKTGYFLDLDNNICYMNKKFFINAGQLGTPEYDTRKRIKDEIPDITFTVVSGRKRSTSPKSKTKYEDMEQFFATFSNESEVLKSFEALKQRSQAYSSPYKYVKDWFDDFNRVNATKPLLNGFMPKAEIVPFPAPEKYKRKKDKPVKESPSSDKTELQKASGE